MNTCRNFWMLAFALPALGACTTTEVIENRNDVEVGMFLPLGAQVAQDQPHVKVLAPAEIATPTPGFPHGLQGDVDVTVCAEVVVAVDGQIASVTQIAGRSGCAPIGDAATAPYFDAVAGALEQWQFFAGGICRFQASEDECMSRDAVIERRAMKLAYFFRFTRVEGVESVSRSG